MILDPLPFPEHRCRVVHFCLCTSTLSRYCGRPGAKTAFQCGHQPPGNTHIRASPPQCCHRPAQSLSCCATRSRTLSGSAHPAQRTSPRHSSSSRVQPLFLYWGHGHSDMFFATRKPMKVDPRFECCSSRPARLGQEPQNKILQQFCQTPLVKWVYTVSQCQGSSESH